MPLVPAGSELFSDRAVRYDGTPQHAVANGNSLVMAIS